MADSSAGISPDISLFDKEYHQKDSHAYHLSIAVHAASFSYSILDVEKNKYIGVEHYVFPSQKDSLAEKIRQINKASKTLLQDYRSISLSVSSNFTSTLIPKPLYEEEKMEEYLKFTAEVNSGEVIQKDQLSSIDAYNIYAVPQKLYQGIKLEFPRAKLFHAGSILLQTLSILNKHTEGKKIFIHFEPENFQVVVMQGQNPVFYNNFHFLSKEDVSYYLLYILEQLKLGPSKAEVEFAGGISESSEILTLAGKYVKLFKEAKRLSNFDYSSSLSELPSHYFFNLFSQYLCV